VNAVLLVLLIPVISAALLALVPGHVLAARLNALASGLTFAVSLILFVQRPATRRSSSSTISISI